MTDDGERIGHPAFPADMRVGRVTTTDGWPLRFGWCPPAGRRGGAVAVLLNGRTEFMEKYAPVIHELNRRHLTVFTLDWRGQGLSPRLLPNRHKGHVVRFDDYLLDLAALLDRVRQTTGERAPLVLAHSMGAHIALRYLHAHSGRFGRLVLTAPMLDVQTFPMPRRAARRLAGLAVRCGWGERYVIGGGDYGPRQRRFAGNRLTADRQRFIAAVQLVENDPRLAVGGVTWGWLAAAYASMDRLARDVRAGPSATPTLMVSAGRDRIVCNRAAAWLCGLLPACRHVRLAAARHEILQERAPVRRAFWRHFDDFTAALQPPGTAMPHRN